MCDSTTACEDGEFPTKGGLQRPESRNVSRKTHYCLKILYCATFYRFSKNYYILILVKHNVYITSIINEDRPKNCSGKKKYMKPLDSDTDVPSLLH